MDMALFAVGATAAASVLIPVLIGYALMIIYATAVWRYKRYVDMKYWREKEVLNRPPYDEIVGIKASGTIDEYHIYFVKNGKRVHRDTLIIKEHL